MNENNQSNQSGQFNRKNAKTLAKLKLSTHYWIFTVAALIAAFLGVEYSFSMETVSNVVLGAPGVVDQVSDGKVPLDEITPFSHNAFDVLGEIINGDARKGQKMSKEIQEMNKANPDVILSKVEMGHKDGVFAKIANSITSGAPFISVYMAISSIVGNGSVATAIFVILSLLVIFFVWALLINTYKAVYRRIFLEGYLYDKVPIKTFLHLLRVKKYLKASLSMLYMTVLKFLWALTIVGGIIKYFSYFLTPYIVAENPDISPRTAIKLSQKMMYGHKMECFKLWLSFIGWYLLEAVTLGISGMFYSNPYKEATFVEYYVHIREESKAKGLENTELLNDDYLYKKAQREDLEAIYSDYGRITDRKKNTIPVNKVWKFFANVFGVVPIYSDAEREYYKEDIRLSKQADYRNIVEGRQYPARLNPIPEKQKNKRLEHLDYRRHYSICSIIVLFFMFAFIGWAWEVCFHLVGEGKFVNRGMLHGPIIPIYGSGGVMALVFLNKLRKRPVICFFVSILMCGVVEYTTGALVEHFTGKRWWDYSGYFLNINGLVCAEGLFVFGLGCMITVYLAAPLIDNLLRKIRLKILLPVCVALVTLTASDIVYSSIVPNSGEGINDFNRTAVTEESSVQSK